MARGQINRVGKDSRDDYDAEHEPKRQVAVVTLTYIVDFEYLNLQEVLEMLRGFRSAKVADMEVKPMNDLEITQATRSYQ